MLVTVPVRGFGSDLGLWAARERGWGVGGVGGRGWHGCKFTCMGWQSALLQNPTTPVWFFGINAKTYDSGLQGQMCRAGLAGDQGQQM